MDDKFEPQIINLKQLVEVGVWIAQRNIGPDLCLAPVNLRKKQISSFH